METSLGQLLQGILISFFAIGFVAILAYIYIKGSIEYVKDWKNKKNQ